MLFRDISRSCVRGPYSHGRAEGPSLSIEYTEVVPPETENNNFKVSLYWFQNCYTMADRVLIVHFLSLSSQIDVHFAKCKH
jgi:hypothetical protein